MNNAVGFLATAITIASYFFKQPSHLRRVQASAATLWILYGVLIDSWPVIVANILVTSIAIWSSIKITPPPAAARE